MMVSCQSAGKPTLTPPAHAPIDCPRQDAHVDITTSFGHLKVITILIDWLSGEENGFILFYFILFYFIFG